jgi:dTMP kinase
MARPRLIETDTEMPPEADRFESLSLRFHENLRQEFLDIAKTEPWRCVVIDANRPVDDVAEAIWAAVAQRLDI